MSFPQIMKLKVGNIKKYTFITNDVLRLLEDEASIHTLLTTKELFLLLSPLLLYGLLLLFGQALQH